MNWQTHMTISGATAAATCSAAGAPMLLTGSVTVVSAFAGLLPDADHADAKIHSWTSVERKYPILKPIGWLLRIPLRPLVFLPHRGPTHWLVTWLAASMVVFVLAILWLQPFQGVLGLGFLIGYGMHIAADCCTPSGVPALAPFSKRECHLVPSMLQVKSTSEGIQRVLSIVVSLLSIGVLYLTYA